MSEAIADAKTKQGGSRVFQIKLTHMLFYRVFVEEHVISNCPVVVNMKPETFTESVLFSISSANTRPSVIWRGQFSGLRATHDAVDLMSCCKSSNIAPVGIVR